MSTQMHFTHSAFLALLIAFGFPVFPVPHSACCDMHIQTLEKLGWLTAQMVRPKSSLSVLIGQPTTNGLPPFLVASSFFMLTCILIQPGASFDPGQTSTVSKNFLFFSAADAGVC